MTDSGSSLPPRDRTTVEAETRSRIERAITRARLVLLWEAVWPRLAPLVVLAGVFAVLSWFGLWRYVPNYGRLAILAVFLGATLYFIVRGLSLRAPDRAAALARVEQATGALHRPATAYTDRLVSGENDPAARALWEAHRRRLLAALDRLKAGIPSPGLARRDPFAFRFLAVLLFVVAFLFAGPERFERLAEAFRGGEPTSATIARIDAWVTPPAYTSRAPIFLTGDAAQPAGTRYSVPAGSVVTVRTGGARDLEVVSVMGGSEAAAETVADSAEAAAAPGAEEKPLERRVTLSKAADVMIRKGDREVAAWSFVVEPDNPPHVAYTRPPGPTRTSALSLAYSLGDDYGVVTGEAEIAPIGLAPKDAEARPLIEAPKIPLTLPQLRTREGSAETIRDLTSHPWAGAKVRLTLLVRDEAGQEGRSEPAEVVLPARRFNNPLARAVVEQRAELAMDANAAPRVADALDAITLAPEQADMNKVAYLAIRSAYYRMLQARNEDDLRGIVDYLWSIALGIEDGDLSLAAQELRAAQEKLRQALEQGASDEEIAKLTQELREAMQKYLQALAEQARKNPNTANLPPNADTRTVRSQDLERMLDQIENLARTGARDAARQLLSELQNMLENLQAGQPMMGGDQQSAEQMMQSLEQLGQMIQRQQELMDKSFRADRGMDPNSGNEQPMSQEQLAEALKQLQQGQQGLQGQLQEMMKALEGMGMQPNGKLGQAGEAMGRAAESLGQGAPGSAVGDQGEALDALRQGAQGLTQQMLANRGQGRGMRGGDNFPNEDPLGRPQRSTGPDFGNSVRVPDEIDTQRAREILETIRKRLSDPLRSEMERNYLERLLDRF